MSLQGEILGLSIAYALLGLLLLLGVTRARLPWSVKAAAIVATSAFYIVAFYKTQGLLGWAALEPLPPQFQLLWARSIEPNRAANAPGAVYLWVEELDDANLPSGVPRAYRLPYSTALARKAEAARTEIMNGRPQAGRAEDFGVGGGQAAPEGPVATARPGDVEPGGDPSSGLLDPAFLGGDSQSVEFAPLPAPKLPPKGPPPF
jgi:hypothetical protein